MTPHPAIVFCAWLLDAVLGDPESMPHPVRIIGKLIRICESKGRRWFVNKKVAGICIGMVIPPGVFLSTLMITKAAGAVSPALETVVSVFIIYTCLSTRSMAKEATAIFNRLCADDTPGARSRLSRIVGRDTAALRQNEVIRAAVESVSESTVDGIVAPLFYAFIGGAPLAMAYKAINTLDSMIGYKNERYREIGWFSARLDDAANLIPARLCLILVPFAGLFMFPHRAAEILRTGLRDGHKSPSPNAGFPEACFAAAFGIRLGGNCFYNGVLVKKPWLGAKQRECTPRDIPGAVRLMWLVSLSALLFFSAARIAFHYVHW